MAIFSIRRCHAHGYACAAIASFMFTVPLVVGLGACRARVVYAHLPDRVGADLPRQRTDSYTLSAAEDQVISSLAFPSGEIASSVILLHQIMPREAVVGSEFPIELHVTNLTTATIENVVALLTEPENLVLGDSSPETSRDGAEASWALGSLGPGQTRVIRASAISLQTGPAAARARVTYENELETQTTIVRPRLELLKTVVPAVVRCEDIQVVYEVANVGSGLARDVVIADTLPDGLVTADGSGEVRVEVGPIGPGQHETRVVTLHAESTGVFVSPARATGAGGLSATAPATVTVVASPRLELEPTAPAQRYIGRQFTHGYTVRNTGDAPARGAVVRVSTPPGAEVACVSRGGVIDGSGVTFELGTIGPGESSEIDATFRARGAGLYRSRATARARCAEGVAAAGLTAVEGVPAVAIEVIEQADPIEVGAQAVYTIRVTNQGSAPGTNIGLVAQLPREMAFLRTAGATPSTTAGRTIIFTPLSGLAPGQSRHWQIFARAGSAGDVRFTVRLMSDQLQTVVEESEATSLYQ